ncbi:MAG: hypothetical protein Q4E64_08025 [Phascolarctobacterium sp.]|uniref:hypothetical protein n=1 Tax=Phascolarctobacterium sp. TaxID=2049039 RepID=UPI0026DC7C9E|nr:hypothetical protein [Phascolarctobacterium sp.]MDO4921756.1 hypothetical protein [Phascolarctobacterium sp.]
MTEKIVTPDSEEDKFILEVREKLHKYLLYEDQYKYGSLDLLEKELDKENPNYKKFLRDKVSESDLWCDIIFILFRESIYNYDKKEILYKNILKFRMLSRWVEKELCTKENIKKDIKFIINEILQYIDEIINEERRGNNFYKLSEDEKNKKLIIINELINKLMIWVKNIIGYEDYRDNSRLKRKLYLILSKTKNDDYERQPLLIFYIVLQILINLKKEIKRRRIRSAYSVISACIVFSLLHSLYYRSYRKKKDKINIINKYRYYFGNELLKYINNRYEGYIQKSQSNEEVESKLRILKLKYEKYVNDRIVFNGVNKHGNDDPVELRKYYYKMRGLLYGLSIVSCNYIDCMAKRGKVVPADFYIELSKAIRNNELRRCKNCGIRVWWPKWWKETANSKEEKQCLNYMEFQYFFWLDEYSKGKLNRIFNCKIKK